MRKLFILIISIFLIAGSAIAQSARITISVANTDMPPSIFIFDQQAQLCSLDKNGNYIALDSKHTATANISLDKPHALSIDFPYNHQKNYLMYTLFLTQGDDLHVNLTFNGADYKAIVTGKGSANNQQDLQQLTQIDLQQYKHDTLPYRAIAAINKQSRANDALLDTYIKKYNPTPAFIKAARAEQLYFATKAYYTFKEDNKFTMLAAYNRNFNKWQRINDSLFKTAMAGTAGKMPALHRDKDAYTSAKLSDAEALASYNYEQLIFWVLLRETEKGRSQNFDDPKTFYKHWYNTTPAEGEKRYENDGRNLFVEKVLNHYFSGETAEYLYASQLRMSILENDYKNIDVLFDHFKQKFPNSKYIGCFTQRIAEIAKKLHGKLNDKMIFAAANGTRRTSPKELMALYKGKTVLIDMWGTWCSPCRQQIEIHSAALHNYFKDKPIVFLYIANFDKGNETMWKKLIAYYQLEGDHILASEKLSRDMMSKLHFSGYPSYFIIRKDGSCKKTKTQYPISRQALIDEIEAAIKM